MLVTGKIIKVLKCFAARCWKLDSMVVILAEITWLVYLTTDKLYNFILKRYNNTVFELAELLWYLLLKYNYISYSTWYSTLYLQFALK